MGTKYSSIAVSGFDASPPADDGTVSEANKVKWSTIKTKLASPINTAIASINSALTTHFNLGPTALVTSTTLDATHYAKFIQVSGSGVTLTLTDAATLTAGWYVRVVNTDTSNTVTLSRATSGDTLNGAAADGVINPGESVDIFVNAAATGFLTTNTAFLTGSSLPKISAVSNLKLTASVGSSALTVAIKGNDGNDPAVFNPVHVPFRSATAATGDTTWLKITAATSLVVSSGSTLGTTNGTAARLWIVGFNDAGTFRLGIINTQITTGIYPLNDSMLSSSTAEGGAGGADSAGVIYTGTAVSAKAMAVLGYIEISQATAGTWASAPSVIQLYHRNIPLPGTVLQYAYTETGAVITTSSSIPDDDSIPQISEGAELMTVVIVTKSAINRLVVRTSVFYATNATNDQACFALFQDAGANAYAAVRHNNSQTNDKLTASFDHFMAAAITGSTTLRIRFGASGNTITVNGAGGARLLGGVGATSISVLEIQA